MSTTELVKLSAAEMAAKIKAKEVSSRELVEAHLAVIESAEPSVKAFLKVSADQALEQADAFDAKSDEDKAQMPELAGVPIAIKDMIVTKGIETTAASKILEGWVPPYDATVIEKLKAAGMPLLGKTNLDEFAQGSSTEHSAYQTTHNPWDTERVPGGSGGGSAAAVAAFEAPLALGTDTGGSIRQPAAFCGVTGIKPTYGTVSRYGLIAYASSLDQMGPIARSAADCAAVLDLIQGKDPRDGTSLDAPAGRLLSSLTGDVRGLKIGIEIRKITQQLPHVHPTRQIAFLRQIGDDLFRLDPRGHAVDGEGAAVRCQQAVGQLEQCRFAAAVGAKQTDDPPRRDLQAHILQRRRRAEALCQIFTFQNRHLMPPCCRSALPERRSLPGRSRARPSPGKTAPAAAAPIPV